MRVLFVDDEPYVLDSIRRQLRKSCDVLTATSGAEALALLKDTGPVALVAVTIAISYLSLVFGELAPKRLALQRAEGFALALGPTIDKVSQISRPVIWLL